MVELAPGGPPAALRLRVAEGSSRKRISPISLRYLAIRSYTPARLARGTSWTTIVVFSGLFTPTVKVPTLPTMVCTVFTAGWLQEILLQRARRGVRRRQGRPRCAC